MANPTQQEIDAFLAKLTDPKDKEIFTALLALLISAQTQAALYAQAIGAMGTLAGQIGINTSQAVTDLNLQVQGSVASLKDTLAKVKEAYDNANNGRQAGMSSAEEFLKIYKQKGGSAGANSGELFKGVAASVLNIVFPGAGKIFDILST